MSIQYQPGPHSTRLLHDSNGHLEPYFPLPARFGPWLTWSLSLIAMGTLLGTTLNNYLAQPAGARRVLGICTLASQAPARNVLGTAMSAMAFVCFVVSWSVFHALSLRLQGTSLRNSVLNRLAYRSGTLLALMLFAAGCALQNCSLSAQLRLGLLCASAACACVYCGTCTWLVTTNQPSLLRSTRDFFWLRLKRVLLIGLCAAFLTR